MKISHGTRITKISGTNGFGYATQGMLKSLQSLGYHVTPNDASADVEIWFDQPEWWKFSEGPYKIGICPWESTKLLPGWADIMNQCDEIWTPSSLIADWFVRYSGITVPVYVYEHGLDHIWTPVERKVEDKLKFLIVGAEATRKNGWQALNYFRQAFGGRDDVEVTMKMVNSSWNGFPRVGKVNFINKVYSFEELQDLFYDHHVLIHISSGEGFGLPPLQAIGSGMPTIALPAWAPYAEFLDPNLTVDSKLVKSSWEIHPGKVFRPDAKQFIERLSWVADNFQEASDFAMSQTEAIHKRYDWDMLTSQAFGALEERLK